MEELEKQSWEKINLSLKHNEEEEQDDSVICDVCRSVSMNPEATYLLYQTMTSIVRN